jgi:hypothetical protein
MKDIIIMSYTTPLFNEPDTDASAGQVISHQSVISRNSGFCLRRRRTRTCVMKMKMICVVTPPPPPAGNKKRRSNKKKNEVDGGGERGVAKAVEAGIVLSYLMLCSTLTQPSCK